MRSDGDCPAYCSKNARPDHSSYPQNEDRIMPKTVQKTKFKFQRGMKKKQAAKTQKKLNYISSCRKYPIRT